MRLRSHAVWVKFRHLRKNKDGATAVEFAILFVPFAMLMFAIIELGITFFITASVNHAMTASARQIRTGQFQQSCGAATQFKALVCEKMSGLGDCQANLRLDVVTSPTGEYEPAMLPPTTTDPDPDDPDEPTIPPDNYIDTPPRAIVVVRAQYYHPLSLPGTYTRLANQPGNRRLITTTTAFRNEPFPSGCTS